MSSVSFLQSLLNQGLLEDIGQDEDKRLATQQAADDLSAHLQTPDGKGDATGFILVALDASTPEDDPVFGIAEKAFTAHFPTYGNAFRAGRPRQLLRFAVLDAVRSAAEADAKVRAAAWYTAASVFPHTGCEVVVAELVRSLGKAVERDASEQWSRTTASGTFTTPPITKAQRGTVEAPTLTGVAASIQKALDADIELLKASGAYNRGVTHDPASWATALGPKLSDSIQTVIETALGDLAERVSAQNGTSDAELKNFAQAVGERVRAAIATADQAGAAEVRRSDLLWWRQTLHSPSLRTGYRDLDPLNVALAAARDLHDLTAGVAPQSVEFLLRETVRAVCGDDGSVVTPAAFAAHAATDHSWQDAYRPPLEVHGAPRRTPLLQYAHAVATGAATAEDGSAWLGPVAEESVRLVDAAVWAYRDFQAAHAVAPVSS